MIWEESFRTVVREIGQQVEVWRDGVLLGTGYAYLEPVFDREDQFPPTDLGLRRRETQVCYGQATLPLDPPQFRDIGLAARSFRGLSPAAARFVEYVKEWVEQEAT